MANFNKAFIMGNLTRDPELRYLPNGTAVTTFTIASNRVYTLPSGEKKEEATFMRVVVWGRRAETCGEYLAKGSSAFVEGRLQSRTWEGQDGQKKSTVEIVADNVQFLGRPKKDAQSTPRPNPQEQPNAMPDVDLPPEGLSQNSASQMDEVPF